MDDFPFYVLCQTEIAAEDTLNYFFLLYLLKKMRLDISCESSASLKKCFDVSCESSASRVLAEESHKRSSYFL